MTEVNVMKADQEDDVLLNNVGKMIRGDIKCLGNLVDLKYDKLPGYLLKKAVNVPEIYLGEDGTVNVQDIYSKKQ